MRLWTKLEEETSFELPEKVKDDFVPLAYINREETREVDIVGTDGNRRSIIVLRKEKEEYLETTRVHTHAEVEYVIPADIDMDGKLEYLVISKDGLGRYKVSAVADEKETFVTDSDVMPFIFSDTKLVPTLFVQKDRKTYFVSMNGSTEVEVKEPRESFGSLRENHSSAYIDVTGNGMADLVLDTERGGKRVVEVWRYTGGEFRKTPQDLVIPEEQSGPLVFGDFTGTGSIDIMYLKNDPFARIVVIPNSRLPYCTTSISANCLSKAQIMKEDVPFLGFDMQTKREYVVSSDDATAKFLLSTAQGPVFPGVLDIDRDTYPDLLLVFEKETLSSVETYSKVYKNTKGAGFEDTPNSKVVLPQGARFQGASFLGSGKGTSDVLISARDSQDASSSLFVSKNLSDFSGYHLSISSVHGRASKDSISPVLGTSYACRIIETGKVIMGFYPPQSGYAPMQSPVVTMGLGKTNVFIGSLHTQVPSVFYPTHVTEDKIVPNSELIMYVSNNRIKPALYLNTNEYWSVAIPIMVTLLFVFGMISVFFTFKEKRKASMSLIKRSRYNIHFDAL
ncbi:integrin alpha FG-GAP repeat containing protein 1 [Nematocida sp. AWRm77]|nr:integrin alpha FG-GAP repeat containing protein 1 [Nematocida sp. AWRm77]